MHIKTLKYLFNQARRNVSNSLSSTVGLTLMMIKNANGGMTTVRHFVSVCASGLHWTVKKGTN